MTQTARSSPRCASAGALVDVALVGKVIDCPTCERPMRVINRAASKAYGIIPPHGSVRTRNTDMHDDLKRASIAWERDEE